MSSFSDLPDDDIEELLAPKKREPKTSVNTPGTNRSRKVDLSIRTYANWFKLQHVVRSACQVPTHDEERSTRNKMVVEIDGVMVCRWCFIEKRDMS
jgi:hypothetical protein